MALGTRGGVSLSHLVSGLWASGADPGALPGGGGRVGTRAGGRLPLPPEALSFPSGRSELVPGGGARGPVGRWEAGARGARPTGRLSPLSPAAPARLAIPKRASWAPSGPWEPGLRGGPTLQRKVCYTPPSHTLQPLPFSSGVVVRTQLQCHHVRTLGSEVTRVLTRLRRG